jgi:hypothetical protein
MRRAILVKMGKRIFYGIILIALSSAVSTFRLNNYLLSFNFSGIIDVIYVLFVTFIPQIIYCIGYSVIFSAAVMLLKYKLMPVHRIEKSYLGIAGHGLKKPVFMCAMLAMPLFLFPMLPARMMPAGDAVRGTDAMLASAGTASSGLPYFGALIGGLIAAANLFIIKPLYLLSMFRLDTAIASVLAASVLYHALTVGLVRRKIAPDRSLSGRFCMEGEPFSVSTKFFSPIPLPGVFIPETKTARKKVGYSCGRRENVLCTESEVSETMRLKEGLYCMDVIPISVFTLPFLHTSIYRISGTDACISVIPKIHYKSRVFVKKPVLSRETGSLIKMQLGSSMEFAGVREYSTGDPLGRIWWKGFAKTGKLLVKEYHAFAEDRWMLVLDLTDSGADEKRVNSMLQFARLFIELCTRKDIFIGLASFSPSFQFSDYSSSKRELLAALSRFNVPMHEISPKGIECIMKDALGQTGLDALVAKSRRAGVSLPMAYSASGLGRHATFFSWKRDKVFEGSIKNFFRRMRKSGKVVLLTDGRTGAAPLKKFKALCGTRSYKYIVVLCGAGPEEEGVLKKERIMHMKASWDDITKPAFVLNLVGRV